MYVKSILRITYVATRILNKIKIQINVLFHNFDFSLVSDVSKRLISLRSTTYTYEQI